MDITTALPYVAMLVSFCTLALSLKGYGQTARRDRVAEMSAQIERMEIDIEACKRRDLQYERDRQEWARDKAALMGEIAQRAAQSAHPYYGPDRRQANYQQENS